MGMDILFMTHIHLHPCAPHPFLFWFSPGTQKPSSGLSGCGAVVETLTAWLHPAWLLPDLLVSYSKVLGR